jgi:hypothetical protein
MMTLLVALAMPAAGAETGELPDSGTVIRRFIERAAASASNRLEGAYVYQRTNVTEEFSRRDTVREREELLLRVTVEEGDENVELLQLNGREPTAEERERELRRFERRRRSDTDRDRPNRSREMNAFITLEVLGGYVFTVRSRELIAGRSCLVVDFRPGPDAEGSGKMFERVLDSLGGTLWLDELEYELVRADVRLLDKVTLWGGVLGGLEQLRLQIERTREPDGRWRDHAVEARFVGRAVTRHIDVRTRDFFSSPRPIAAEPLVAAE